MSLSTVEEIEREIATDVAECGCDDPGQHDESRRCESAGWGDNGVGGQIWESCPNAAEPHGDYCTECLEGGEP